jgi:hypothetical protein
MTVQPQWEGQEAVVGCSPVAGDKQKKYLPNDPAPSAEIVVVM